jgi:hypothetical protein
MTQTTLLADLKKIRADREAFQRYRKIREVCRHNDDGAGQCWHDKNRPAVGPGKCSFKNCPEVTK